MKMCTLHSGRPPDLDALGSRLSATVCVISVSRLPDSHLLVGMETVQVSTPG